MLTGIEIDALDVPTLEAFWSEATRGLTGGLQVRFVQTTAAKQGKNRLHFDLAGGPNWEAEVERLLALGAKPADIGQGDVPWDVLADPEGNEFCVLRPGHLGLRTDIGLGAICLDVAAEHLAAQSAFWQARAVWSDVEHSPWGERLRRSSASPVSLVLGPPAAPKAGRNRLRLVVTDPTWESGEFLDPGGNEFRVLA